MTFPERTKPNIYGAVVGAGAVSSLGLACDGLTISSDTQEIADGLVEEQGRAARMQLPAAPLRRPTQSSVYLPVQS